MLRFVYCVLLAAGLAVGTTMPVPAAEAVAQQTPPPEVKQLLQLMQSPPVRAWLASADSAESAPMILPAQSLSRRADDLFASARRAVDALIAAAPELPAAFATAGQRLSAELTRERGWWNVLVLLLAVGVGLALEALFVAATQRAEAHTSPAGWDAFEAGRHLSRLAVFAAGVLVILFLLEQPPLIRQRMIALLIACVATRLGVMLSAFLFPDRALKTAAGSGAEHDRAASFRRRRLALAIGVAVIGWAVVDMLEPLGFSDPEREIVEDVFAFVLLLIGVEATWRVPQEAWSRAFVPHHLALRCLATLALVLLWMLYAADLYALFWPAFLVWFVPTVIGWTRTAIRHWRAAGVEGAEVPVAPSFAVVAAERFIRVVLVLGAALILASAWHLNPTDLTNRDSLNVRLLRGLLSGLVILFVADLVWNLAKSSIDRTVSASSARTGLDPAAAARHARLRTLLPILRNILFIVIATMAVLMALSALGVAIGPLIAGAGVVGVAVGFGAQTLVKDIIAGIFYLLDDAFRVGEYVQSGKYAGTVESFSLRSVRLRNPRGGVFTVPFGELGAIENLSRDWAIDKFTVNVRYDTDFAKAKKLVKQVSAELLADPEVGPSFIEPLKLQGIQELAAYSVALRLKMTVRPGEQTTVRRRALALIKSTFEANGIEFPYPIVKVEGTPGDQTLAAAAQQALRLANQSSAA